ncbi:MAG: hypothetical protein U0263_08895 [Polyangiaceae bacterium]
MHDQRDGRDGRDGNDCGHDHGGGSHQHGPSGSEFLELELSRMLYSRASEVAKEVAVEILRDAVRERLRERIGDKLRAIGRLAADELAEDVAVNLEIEARIAAHMQRGTGVGARLEAAIAQTARGDAPETPARAGRSRRRRR